MKRDVEYLKGIGAKIASARKVKGFTGRQFAELCKLDYSGLARIELGQKSLQILTLKRIADTLGMDAKEFL